MGIRLYFCMFKPFQVYDKTLCSLVHEGPCLSLTGNDHHIQKSMCTQTYKTCVWFCFVLFFLLVCFLFCYFHLLTCICQVKKQNKNNKSSPTWLMVHSVLSTNLLCTFNNYIGLLFFQTKCAHNLPFSQENQTVLCKEQITNSSIARLSLLLFQFILADLLRCICISSINFVSDFNSIVQGILKYFEMDSR